MTKVPRATVQTARTYATEDQVKQTSYYIRLGERMLSTRTQESLGYFTQALTSSLRLKQPELIFKSYMALGKANAQLDHIAEALSAYHNALAVAKSCKLAQTGVLKALYMLYKTEGDNKNALRYCEALYKAELQSKSEPLITDLPQNAKSFIHHVLHDMREPIRIINIYNSLLQKSIEKADGESSDIYLNHTNKAVKRIRHLMKNLSEYIMLYIDDANLEAVNLNEVVEVVENELKVIIQTQEVSINYDKLPDVQANFGLMAQLLYQVILNAILYRKQDIAPKILISSKQIDTDYHIIIQDNGKGISEESLSKLLDVSHGPVKSKGKHPSSGLGLLICKKIVDKYQGKIWINSNQGEGTNIHFTLPVPKKTNN